MWGNSPTSKILKQLNKSDQNEIFIWPAPSPLTMWKLKSVGTIFFINSQADSLFLARFIWLGSFGDSAFPSFSSSLFELENVELFLLCNLISYLNTKSGTPFFVAFPVVVTRTDSSLQQIIELAPLSPHLMSWLAFISFDFNLSSAHLQVLKKMFKLLYSL